MRASAASFLSSLLSPVLQVKRVVEKKALMRLKDDNLLAHTEATTMDPTSSETGALDLQQAFDRTARFKDGSDDNWGLDLSGDDI